MALILVVDDELIVRQLFERVLRGEGHEVIVAANGREALLAMGAPGGRTPDLVLLDVVMPVMDGISFLKAMRRRPDWANVPVIVVSGVIDRQQVVQVLKLRACDYLLKSAFSLDDLRARMAKHLERKREQELPQGGARDAKTVKPRRNAPKRPTTSPHQADAPAERPSAPPAAPAEADTEFLDIDQVLEDDNGGEDVELVVPGAP